MDLVLAGIKYDHVLVYIDDLIIFSRTSAEHALHLDSVLSRLESFGLHVGIDKCSFAQPEVHFLGHTVSAQGLRPDASLIKTVRDWPEPKDSAQVRSFLALCGYYRQFVLHFSDIAEPLQALTHKGVPFIFDVHCRESFVQLKQSLISSPVLSFPSFDRPFVLCTDASDVAMGAVLEQPDDLGQLHPVAYFSKTLNSSQRNYHVTDRECLSLVEAITHWSPFLSLGHFQVFTDHRALTCLNKTDQNRNVEGRLARWQLTLQRYSFTVHHRPGRINSAPDALSRLDISSLSSPLPLHFTASIASISLGDSSSFAVLSSRISAIHASLSSNIDSLNPDLRSQIITAQSQDIELAPLIFWLRDAVVPSDRKSAQLVFHRGRSMDMINGILVQHSALEGPPRIVLPNSLVDQMIDQYHATPSVGAHFGAAKVYDQIQRRFWCRGLYTKVLSRVALCSHCQQTHLSHQKPVGGPLIPTPVPAFPFDKIALDFVGPIRPTIHGNRHILVITDYFSRWSEAYPVPNQQADTVAQCLAEWCSHFGAPLTVCSDRGSAFIGEVIHDYCRLWGMKQQLTASYHPMANGLVERMNGTLCDSIRAFCNDVGVTWDESISAILFVYRNSIHAGISNTPAYLVFGRHLRSPLDAQIDSFLRSSSSIPSDSDFLFSQAQRLSRAWDIARKTMQTYQRKYAARFDAAHREEHFAPGDTVWLKVEGFPGHFGPRFTGPFRVFERISDTIYRINDINGVPFSNHVAIERLRRAVIPAHEIYSLPDEPAITANLASQLVSQLSSGNDSFSSSSSFSFSFSSSHSSPTFASSTSLSFSFLCSFFVFVVVFVFIIFFHCVFFIVVSFFLFIFCWTYHFIFAFSTYSL